MPGNSFADHILSFYKNIPVPKLPGNIQSLYPYKDETVQQVMQQFFQKYFDDAAERHMIVGINPGRFGAGVTGICFTDRLRLKVECGIENNFALRQELSSVFIYKVIEAMGGAAAFYKQFYITAFSPVGFVSQGKNINYYDDKQLCDAVLPYAVKCMKHQLKWPVKKDKAFCIGEGKNLHYLSMLNAKHKWFSQVIPLPHPRFIMQYKLKQIDRYVDLYVTSLSDQ